MKLEAEARAIGFGLSSKVGFDPLSILTLLLPMLLNCFSKTETQSPGEFLRDHFDEDTKTFDSGLIERARPTARRAARKAFRSGKSDRRSLSRDELDQITVATFQHAMDADDQVLSDCADEAIEIDTDAE